MRDDGGGPGQERVRERERARKREKAAVPRHALSHNNFFFLTHLPEELGFMLPFGSSPAGRRTFIKRGKKSNRSEKRSCQGDVQRN
jgi:hypothetical protein